LAEKNSEISIVKENFSLTAGHLGSHFQIGIVKGVKERADFMLFSVGKAFICNLVALNALLNSGSVRTSFVSIRYSEIGLHLAKFSPRLPMVDPHFIFVNLKYFRIEDLLLQIPKTNNHFNRVGGIHYEIIGLIEKNFQLNEVFNIFSGNVYDLYGEKQGKLNLIPYSYCEEYGLMTAYQDFDVRLRRLILENCFGIFCGHHFLRYKKSKSGFLYCRKFFNLDSLKKSKIINFLRQPFNTSKYEIQKKYKGDVERGQNNESKIKKISK